MRLLKRIFGGGREVPRSDSQPIARSLFQHWVQKDQAPPFPIGQLPKSIRIPYQSKWRLYREAIVLLALLSKERSDPRQTELVREYERLIYPTSRQALGATVKLVAMKSAMNDLAELYEGEHSEGAWGKQWFEQLGELPNPVDCWLFSNAAMQMLAAVSQMLEDTLSLNA